MSSLKRQRTATSLASIVQGKNAKKIWTILCSEPLLTNVPIMDQEALASTFLASLFSIQMFLKQSRISRIRTRNIPSYLQQMGHCLTNLRPTLKSSEWTELSGAGDEITLQLKLLVSLKKSEWSGYFLKKRQKKSSRGGRSFRG